MHGACIPVQPALRAFACSSSAVSALRAYACTAWTPSAQIQQPPEPHACATSCQGATHLQGTTQQPGRLRPLHCHHHSFARTNRVAVRCHHTRWCAARRRDDLRHAGQNKAHGRVGLQLCTRADGVHGRCSRRRPLPPCAQQHETQTSRAPRAARLIKVSVDCTRRHCW